MTSTDRYTKVALTVIALCLVWLALGGPSLLTPLSAQQVAVGQDGLIRGWVDENGVVYKFAQPQRWNNLPAGGRSASLPAWVNNVRTDAPPNRP